MVTVDMQTTAYPKHWTVITHAHPTAPAAPGLAPLDWAADTVLDGSLTRPVVGNYNGKYFEDHGRPYLLYVDTIVPPPGLRNATFLQPMPSPTQLDPAPRTMLLKPGDRHGALDSEFYASEVQIHCLS